MNVCISATLLCFRYIVVAMAGFALNWFLNFMWVFTSHFRPQSPNKKKKKAVRKKKKSPIKSITDISLKDNSHVNGNSQVNDNSQMKDTKDGSVDSIRVFTYQTLVDATQNFELERRLNIDSLGPVHKGNMIETNEVVAIRRVKNSTFQSLEDFVGEVLLLSQTNHPNLAKLIGYCVQRYYSRLLVYKYESCGSLHNHLHGNQQSCLEWKLRMKIALGVAKAVEYLQSVMKPPMLHCYIEPSNIWLDEKMSPKLSAFGVVRMYPPLSGSDFCFETIGSYFYGSHDKGLVKEVTVQTDVRGFGILLLEMITGMKGRFRAEDGFCVNLTDWVRPYFEDKANLASMVDPKLEGKFDVEELHCVCKLAEACIEKQPSLRPRISDVVKILEGLVS